MIGKQILHYNIIEKLGEGGMGVVYLAEDNRLERQVAIKFLPQHISANSDERKRFEIEAKAAAALNHPNIATIYAIEEADDQLFLVMEYITGKNLKDFLKEKKLTWQESLKIALQLAQALKAAHKNSIIHRDVKTANIMSNEDDVIKIMDFGLAKFRGSAQLTQIGTTIGTAAYMSPEQARGEEADKRSDIWSFGVVFYEMLTGEIPFKGEYEQAVLYAMLNEDPQSISKINPAVPDPLVAVVEKCLQKTKENRYQDVSDIINDLEAIHTGNTSNISAVKTVTTPKKNTKIIWLVSILALLIVAVLISVYALNDINNKTEAVSVNEIKKLAILPFSNLKPDPETDYLGYALADQIVGAMSYVKSITVRPSSAIRKYQGQTLDMASVGSDLGVNYILTGNYLKQGDIVRLNIELVNSATNDLMWRDVIEENYENSFRFQDIISEKIITGLAIQFSPKEKALLSADAPSNALAYEYYLKAVAYPLASESNKLAIQMLEKAIQLDSTFAPSYEEMGQRYHQLAVYTFGGIEQYNIAENYFKKAIELKPDFVRAIAGLAVIYTEINRKEEALEMSRKILDVNPNNADAHFLLSYIYRYAGIVDEAKKEAEMAVKINPDAIYRSGGHVFLSMGEYDKAIEFYELDKDSPFYYGNAGYAYLKKGNTSKAIELFKKVRELDPNSTNEYFVLAMMAHLDGSDDKAIEYLELIESDDLKDGEMWYALAFDYARYGAAQESINALNKAIYLGFYNYPAIMVEKDFDSLRNNKEFQQVVEKAKEKHIAFKKKYFPEKVNPLP